MLFRSLVLLFVLPSSLFFALLVLISFTTQLTIGDTLISVAFSPLRMARNIQEFEENVRGTERPIRVMTFNIWGSGMNVKDGLEKIAKHIAKVDPDIVALQVRENEYYMFFNKNDILIIKSLTT